MTDNTRLESLAGVLVVIYAVALQRNDTLAVIQTVAVVLTGAVIVWYTWETFQLRLRETGRLRIAH